MNRTRWLQDRRMQKFRDVLSRWERKELSAMEAGELLGCSERQFRRYRRRYEEEGLAGLADRRLGKASMRRVPVDKLVWMLGEYRTHHLGWNVKHFHEHIRQQHGFPWGYTWTKTQLHTAGLVERAARRGAHRRKRPRKPCEGMMLHQDGSRFAWLSGSPELDLIVTMDDATSTIYSAFLVEEEGTVSTFCGLLEVFTAKGLAASLYTDRGSHYFYTPKAGKLAGIYDIEAANRFIREVYLPAHNARFAKPPQIAESGFVAADAAMLAEILCIEVDRVVARDNTVSHNGRCLQLPASPLRAHYVKACAKVREYPDGTLAVFHGPRRIARYDAEGAEVLVPTAGSLTPCSPPSRRGLVAAEFAASVSRRPALTAAARGVPAPARVGTKKRPSDRTKKLTGKELRLTRSAPV